MKSDKKGDYLEIMSITQTIFPGKTHLFVVLSVVKKEKCTDVVYSGMLCT